MDMYDTADPDYLQLIGARVIGRNMGNMLQQSDGLRNRITGILLRRANSWWGAMEEGLRD